MKSIFFFILFFFVERRQSLIDSLFVSCEIESEIDCFSYIASEFQRKSAMKPNEK